MSDAKDLTRGMLPGSALLTANMDAGGFRITNLADPTSAQDAATKAYADALANGLTVKAGVVTAATSALPNGPCVYVAGVLTAASTGATGAINGKTVGLGDRILVVGEAASQYDGIYTATVLGAVGVKAVWTRATDADTVAKLPEGTTAYITDAASSLVGASYILTSVIAVLGVTAQTWTQGAIGLSNTTPTPIGTAAVGTELGAARGDHTHDGATTAQGAKADAALPKAGGAMTGDIDMGTHSITNATRFTGDVTGNVTGNCSGSSGSCTGNAATATTCPSGSSTGTNTGDQTITLTGDVTGTGTGSFAATIVGAAPTMMNFGNTFAVNYTSGGGTYILNPFTRGDAGPGTSNTTMKLIVPFACKISAMYGKVGTTITGSGSPTLTLKVQVNGSQTGTMAVALVAASGTTPVANTGAAISLNAGDEVSIQMVVTGTQTATITGLWAVLKLTLG